MSENFRFLVSPEGKGSWSLVETSKIAPESHYSEELKSYSEELSGLLAESHKRNQRLLRDLRTKHDTERKNFSLLQENENLRVRAEIGEARAASNQEMCWSEKKNVFILGATLGAAFMGIVTVYMAKKNS